MKRDLLLLTDLDYLPAAERQRSLAEMMRLLSTVENWTSFSQANEVLDLNRHRILTQPHRIQQQLQDFPNKPFVFVVGKN